MGLPVVITAAPDPDEVSFVEEIVRKAKAVNLAGRLSIKELGALTASRMLADAAPRAIAAVLRDSSLAGLYHMTASGSTTWCGFARAIIGDAARVRPVSSSEYPTPARRPRNSVLDNGKLARQLSIRLASWEAGLKEMLQAL